MSEEDKSLDAWYDQFFQTSAEIQKQLVSDSASLDKLFMTAEQSITEKISEQLSEFYEFQSGKSKSSDESSPEPRTTDTPSESARVDKEMGRDEIGGTSSVS